MSQTCVICGTFLQNIESNFNGAAWICPTHTEQEWELFCKKPWYTEYELRLLLKDQYHYQKESRIDDILKIVKTIQNPLYINRNNHKHQLGILKLTCYPDMVPEGPVFTVENKKYSSIAQAREHGF